MKNFYKENKAIKIDLYSMYDNHVNVIRRYEDENETINDIIEKFIPQVVEEMYEFEVEIDKLMNSDNKSKDQEYLNLASLELLDIILYLVSINSSLLKFYNYNEYNQKYLYNTHNYTLMEEFDKRSLSLISKSLISTVTVKLGQQRRLIPNRKYHEEKVEVTDEQISEVAKEIFEINNDLIIKLFKVLFNNFLSVRTYKSALNKIQDVVKNK